MRDTSARLKPPRYALVAITGVLLGFVVASVLNTQLMGMSFPEIVAVFAVVTIVVMAGYTALRHRKPTG